MQKTLIIDLEKALQMKNVVAAGDFAIPHRPPRKDSLSRRQAFIQDLKRSINGDGDLRQLLLDKGQVRQLALLPHTKALLVQHRSVWGQKAFRLKYTADDLLTQVKGIVTAIYEEAAGDNPSLEEALLKLIQREIDMEAEKDDLCREIDDAIETFDGVQCLQHGVYEKLDSLKREEASLMNQIFWLNSGNAEADGPEIDAGVTELAICTALSPSAKPTMAPGAGKKLAYQLESGGSKRASLDSGYADSSTSDQGNDEGTSIVPEGAVEAQIAAARDGSDKRRDFEKVCDKCQRKMSVKFDFDKMETEGDPEAWVLFNCSMCASPVDDSEQEDLDDTNDAITDQFTAILQDVTVYYTKKLDMYRIKMEHHQRTRPDRQHYELAMILIEIYGDHPNSDELWKDIFCRIVGDDAMPIHATSIQRWMQEELQIKAAMKACLSDLRRERDKVVDGMEKLRLKAKENKTKMKVFKAKRKEQLEQCQQLHASLKVLRLSREEKVRLEAKAKEEHKFRLDRAKAKKLQQFHERQRQQWSQIRAYRRNQEEIKAERRFHLHQELKATVKHRREKALQDFIRVNLRRVMAEQRILERKAQIAAKEEADMEQDARLETLRKSARRRLGLGILNQQQQTALLPTVASASKVREKAEEDENADIVRRRDGRPLFKLYTFSEQEILADPRLVVENVLRERGLLQGSKYAVDQILKEFKPPRKPRPDLKSQLGYITEEP